MHSGAPRDVKFSRLLGLVLVLAPTLPCLVPPAHAQANECLVQFRGLTGIDTGKVTCNECDPTCGDTDHVKDNKCSFAFEICLNQGDASCTAATAFKKAKAKGKGLVGQALPLGSGCYPFMATVNLKKNGQKKGMTKIKAMAISDTKPKRKDIDTLVLECDPQPAPTCPTTTTTTTLPPCGNGVLDPGEQCDPAASSSACPAGQGCNPQCQCAQVACDPIVPGQAIANTYNIQDVTGPGVCKFGTAANQLQPCQSDADCGGEAGGCLPTPWISAGGVVLPFPLGISATFTVAVADSPPTCSHPVCIACGNPNATCAGMTGCASNPNCISATPTCCDQPAFTVPTFFLSGLNVCVKVDQKACGVGVVNTSNPQTGDSEVVKMGDTSDPGLDCSYGTPDDPAAKPCGTLAGGAGRDKAGKVVRTLGNGTPDSSGVHSRFTVPLLATAWVDKPPPGQPTCPPTATFDPDETLMAQLLLNAELSTAGATGAFVDMNSDTCAVAGVGFGGDATMKVGPITLGPPTLSPAPYGGGNNLMGSAGLVFPGSGPLYDIGFIALVPFGQPTVVASQSCTCTVTPGCPE